MGRIKYTFVVFPDGDGWYATVLREHTDDPQHKKLDVFETDIQDTPDDARAAAHEYAACRGITVTEDIEH